MTHPKLQADTAPVGLSGWLPRFGALSLVFGAATALMFLWRGHWHAALLAGGICYLGASVGFWLLAWGATPQQALVSLAGAILCRTLLPLVAALVVESQFPWLREQGFMGQVVVVYLIGLAAETALVVPIVQRRQASLAGSAGTGSEHG